MTDAEDEVVNAALEARANGSLRGTHRLLDAVDVVYEARKPPPPRTITPEELAVIEAAKGVIPSIERWSLDRDMTPDTRKLVEAVRRLK